MCIQLEYHLGHWKFLPLNLLATIQFKIEYSDDYDNITKNIIKEKGDFNILW